MTEGEPIGSHELFNRLISKQTLEGEEGAEESELKYLHVIKELRDKAPDLFETIKRLPKKARTAKVTHASSLRSINKNHKQDACDTLITYFRRGKLQKFFKADRKNVAEEMDFISAAKLLESSPDETKEKLPEQFYDLLDKNKEAFILATTEEMPHHWQRGGRDSAANIIRILKATLKNTQKLTEDQELYLKKVLTQLEEGGLPKQTTKKTLKALDEMENEIMNPLKILAVLQMNIPERFLAEHYAERNPRSSGKREVILSMYLTG